MNQIAIMVGRKGRGSNMAALAKACADGSISAQVAFVLSPAETSPAVETAKSLGLAIKPFDLQSPTAGADISDALLAAKVDLLCLAGFMNLLPKRVIQAMDGRVLNIHPALLPKFGGKGMYGMHVHNAVIVAQEPISGCTVHWVTDEYDEGAVVHQLTCPVLPEDTADDLAARVLALEHQAYAEAVQRVLTEGVRP